MERKIILSADSTCDLGSELKELHQVNYYPFHIILEDKQYQDNVDIIPDEIFKNFYEKKILPKTAAINVSEYIDYFKQWTDKGYDVIHLNLGSALSSAHQNALIAANELGHIYPIDSCSLSTGISLLVLQASKMIKEGFTAQVISQRLKEMTKEVHASFVVDTLEFLHAGGRCSTIAALGANLLHLKPSIEVNNENGAMTVGKKYRGELDKVLIKYTKDKLNQYDGVDTSTLFITHSGIPDSYIELVRNTINETLAFDNIYVTRASCTISSHCGPNTLGILFMTTSE